jgi:hypothetical protein
MIINALNSCQNIYGRFRETALLLLGKTPTGQQNLIDANKKRFL